ncbi:MAG: type II secretion system protein [Alphaproteobacteria bacterium]|nr:type II secretion system protein [Alphaproteobacteria bacterium]
MSVMQSGRSMVEMLGVLAIVGVLSIGALSGYSTAMEKYKINLAVQEIKEIIIAAKDAKASGQAKYDEMSLLLNKTGVYKNVYDGYPHNVYELKIGFFSTNPTYFVLDYWIPNKKVCKRLLLERWEELGGSLRSLVAYPGGGTFTIDGSEGEPMPVTVSDAEAACTDTVQLVAFRVY